jgi:hypothetical protein
MRLYFLVEGRRTEAKVYPAWLSHLVPGLNRIRRHDDDADNSYFLISAEGYPSIYDYLADAVEDVNAAGNYDYLVVCLDSDESSVEDRLDEVNEMLAVRGATLNTAQLVTIVQNRCIETWFLGLGNRRIVKRNPQSAALRDYLTHYDIVTLDPEAMDLHPRFSTHAQFHVGYLRVIFQERGLSYSKRSPGVVLEQYFVHELTKRLADEPDHLQSLRRLIEFLNSVATHVAPPANGGN